MAEDNKKKYLDLTGLSYTVRKIDTKKANVISPAFTGTPSAPTAEKGTKTTQLATTEFVDAAIADYVEKKDYVTDAEIKDMFNEILDGAGDVVDPTTFAQLVYRVEQLEAAKPVSLDVAVEDQILVFTKE